ncbi:GNAT family protein [Haladaptatus sp. DYF46]|uniref:GNAT family N-acetyltransferase n=1 Tax=Haladaptatus sp. DYF46 TaxID=2886041 RepID=UPI001E62DABB|nr:GNAT family protein [Haladaptatus sp. DYF46]
MPGAVFLAGELVSLRTVEREDLSFLHRNRNDPTIRRWMPRVMPQNKERLVEDFEGYMSEDEGVNLLACSEENTDEDSSPEPVGFVSLFDVNETSGRAKLAAWITPAQQGQGYATEAMDLLVEYAFVERRLHKLIAGALATNNASCEVLEKLGFIEEGRQREYYYVNGEYVNRAVYGLLKDQWQSQITE